MEMITSIFQVRSTCHETQQPSAQRKLWLSAPKLVVHNITTTPAPFPLYSLNLLLHPRGLKQLSNLEIKQRPSHNEKQQQQNCWSLLKPCSVHLNESAVSALTLPSHGFRAAHVRLQAVLMPAQHLQLLSQVVVLLPLFLKGITEQKEKKNPLSFQVTSPTRWDVWKNRRKKGQFDLLQILHKRMTSQKNDYLEFIAHLICLVQYPPPFFFPQGEKHNHNTVVS